MANFLDGRKPDITYPCPWTYRLIGADEQRVRSAVLEVIGTETHTLVLARESSAGRYRTLELELVVRDESHRLELFERFARHPDVRFVL